MSEKTRLLESIVNTISDYREGDLDAPTPTHIDHWVNQFDTAVQLQILRELDHVFKKTYFSRTRTIEFLTGLITTKKLVGDNPCAFWKRVRFLDIQGGGASQTQMIALFSKLLTKNCGFEAKDCGGEDGLFVYIDDAAFSGNRIKQDIEGWIVKDAPKKATLHIITIALHTGAQFYAEHYSKGNIQSAAMDAGKDITCRWWRALTLENQKSHADESDVLWPVRIPDDPAVSEYVGGMIHRPSLRRAGQVGGAKIFSSDEARQLLEEEFLKAGVRIRQKCPYLNKYQRPLGNMLLETLGFGSMIVTFRNCPNNAPLALWAGDPWYPLFPRATNSDTSLQKFMAMLAREIF